jgi:signal peptidase II
MNRQQRFLLTTSVLLLSVGCDQATKRVAVAMLKDGPVHHYLLDTVRLQYAENPGAFLSLGASLPPLVRQLIFTGGVGLLLLGFAVASFTMRSLPASRMVALAALAGGGFGNWVDRVMQGGVVVDFMNVGIGPVRTGIFNVADLAIMAGALFLAWPLKTPPPPQESPPQPPAPA